MYTATLLISCCVSTVSIYIPIYTDTEEFVHGVVLLLLCLYCALVHVFQIRFCVYEEYHQVFSLVFICTSFCLLLIYTNIIYSFTHKIHTITTTS